MPASKKPAACPRTRRAVVAAMKRANIKGEVSGSGADWEVELPDERTMRAFQRKVCRAGGSKTGYGSWILRGKHQDRGDFNDRSSRWHY